MCARRYCGPAGYGASTDSGLQAATVASIKIGPALHERQTGEVHWKHTRRCLCRARVGGNACTVASPNARRSAVWSRKSNRVAVECWCCAARRVSARPPCSNTLPSWRQGSAVSRWRASSEVLTDPAAPYFGAVIDDGSIVPGAGATLFETRFTDWLVTNVLSDAR